MYSKQNKVKRTSLHNEDDYLRALEQSEYGRIREYIKEDIKLNYKSDTNKNSLEGNFNAAVRSLRENNPHSYERFRKKVENGSINNGIYDNDEEFLIVLSENGSPELKSGYVDILKSLIIHGNKTYALIIIKDIKKARGAKFANKVVDGAHSLIANDRTLSNDSKNDALSFFDSRTYWKQGVTISSKNGVVSVSTMPGRLYITVPILLVIALLIATPFVYDYMQPVAISDLDIKTSMGSEIQIGKSFYVSYVVEPENADTSDVKWSISPSNNGEIIPSSGSSAKVTLYPGFKGDTVKVICQSVKYEQLKSIDLNIVDDLESRFTLSVSGDGSYLPGEEFTITSTVQADISIPLTWHCDSKIEMISKDDNRFIGKVSWSAKEHVAAITATINDTDITKSVDLSIPEFMSVDFYPESRTIDVGASGDFSVSVSPNGNLYDYSVVRWSKDASWITLSNATGSKVTVGVTLEAPDNGSATVSVRSNEFTGTFTVNVGKSLGAKITTKDDISDLGPESHFNIELTTESQTIDLSTLKFESPSNLVTVKQSGKTARISVANLADVGDKFTISAKLEGSVVASREFILTNTNTMTITGSAETVDANSDIHLKAILNPAADAQIEWSCSDTRISISKEGNFKVPLSMSSGTTFTVKASVSGHPAINASKTFTVGADATIRITYVQLATAGMDYTATASTIVGVDLSKAVWSFEGPASKKGSESGSSITYTVDKWAEKGEQIRITVKHPEIFGPTTETIEVSNGFSITLISSSERIHSGESVTFTANTSPSDIDYGVPTWSVDSDGISKEEDGNKCTFTPNIVQATDKTVGITVHFGEKTRTAHLIVNATKIDINHPDILRNGESFTNTATVNIDSYDSLIRWTLLDNTSGASLSQTEGKITIGTVPLAAGDSSFVLKAYIQGTNVQTLATYNVTQLPLTLYSSVDSCTQGDSVTFTAEGYEEVSGITYQWDCPFDATKTYQSGNTAVFKISDTISSSTTMVFKVTIYGTSIQASKTIDVTYDYYKYFVKLYATSDVKKIVESDMSGKYVLMEDVYMTSPIGSYSTWYSAFKGLFDGNGHTINFDYAATPYISGGNASVGIFAEIDGGTIMDLNANVHIVAQKHNSEYKMNTGGICGRLITGTISSCTVSGLVKTSEEFNECRVGSYTGGIVGQACGNSYIEYCTNRASVNSWGSWSHAGGILGGVPSNTCNVSYCLNEGNIFSQGNTSPYNIYSYQGEAGGIVGCVTQSAGNVNISHCASIATMIKSCGRYHDSGGILGRNAGNYYISDSAFKYGSPYEYDTCCPTIIVDGGYDASKVYNSYYYDNDEDIKHHAGL